MSTANILKLTLLWCLCMSIAIYPKTKDTKVFLYEHCNYSQTEEAMVSLSFAIYYSKTDTTMMSLYKYCKYFQTEDAMVSLFEQCNVF